MVVRLERSKAGLAADCSAKAIDSPITMFGAILSRVVYGMMVAREVCANFPCMGANAITQGQTMLGFFCLWDGIFPVSHA
jgi:hypothetical protein